MSDQQHEGYMSTNGGVYCRRCGAYDSEPTWNDGFCPGWHSPEQATMSDTTPTRPTMSDTLDLDSLGRALWMKEYGGTRDFWDNGIGPAGKEAYCSRVDAILQDIDRQGYQITKRGSDDS